MNVQRFQSHSTKNSEAAFGLAVIVVVLAGVALSGAAIAYYGLSWIPIGGALVAATVWLWRSTWRHCIYALVGIMVFEGIVSLALYPSRWPLLLRDVVLVAAYVKYGIACLQRREQMVFSPPFHVPFCLITIWAIVQSTNPNLPVITMALIGLRTLVGYMPLAWLAVSFFSDWRTVIRFIDYLLVLGSVTSVVACVQFWLGIEWFRSLGPGFDAGAYQVGGTLVEQVYRVNATFSAPGHFGAFVAPLLLLAVALQQCRAGKLLRAFRVNALGLLVIGLFVNNQRATMLIVAAGLVVMLVGQRRFWAPRAQLRLILGVAGGLPLAVLVAGVEFQDRLLSFALNPWNVVVRQHLVDPFVLRAGQALETTWLGMGTGSATTGARYLADIWEGSESFIAAVIYELGLLGVAGVTAILAIVLGSSLVAWGRTSGGEQSWIAASVVAYQLGIVAMLGTYAWIEYGPTLVLFWLLAGMIQRLPRLSDPGSQPAGLRPAPGQTAVG